MKEQANQSEHYKPRKWYNSHIFPLIPTLRITKKTEHNTSGFTFKWLFITLWTLDSFEFEFAIVATTHWGIGFVGILPRLRWVLSIPCPQSLDRWIYRNLNRKSEYDKQHLN
jgi:hypothetical protein